MEHQFKIQIKGMPEREEANEFREWLGMYENEVWDADAFYVDEANAAVEQI